jgi:transposase
LAAEESKNSGKKNRGCYKAYTEEQIAEFVNLVNNGMSQRKAVEKMHIKQRTTIDYYQRLELKSNAKSQKQVRKRRRLVVNPNLMKNTQSIL